MRCEYISEDGKFRSEDENAVDEYEFNVIVTTTGIVWCGEHGEPCDLEGAWYMYVPSEEVMGDVRGLLYDRYGVDLPKNLHAGYLYYDEDDDAWVNVDSRISAMNEKIAELERMSAVLDQRVVELNDAKEK